MSNEDWFPVFDSLYYSKVKAGSFISLSIGLMVTPLPGVREHDKLDCPCSAPSITKAEMFQLMELSDLKPLQLETGKSLFDD
ncbi:hypothetical protein [Fluviicola taffensis]|uniref:hypothetical protein n=1 Tax=Fluviicola taffensis TaxID=191579 RepID=UPI003137B975